MGIFRHRYNYEVYRRLKKAVVFGVASSVASVTVSQTEVGDTTSATLETLRQITSSQTEAGDATAATLETLRQVTANQTESGDTTAATVNAASSVSITVSQVETGDTITALVSSSRNIAASQTEDVNLFTLSDAGSNDTYEANSVASWNTVGSGAAAVETTTVYSGTYALKFSGTAGGSSDRLYMIFSSALPVVPSTGQAYKISITARHGGVGDDVRISLESMDSPTVNVCYLTAADTTYQVYEYEFTYGTSYEYFVISGAGTPGVSAVDIFIDNIELIQLGGDSTTATLETLCQVTASQAETGDAAAATLERSRLVTVSQTEGGDANNTTLQVLLQVNVSQVESGDITSAAVNASDGVTITVNQSESGDNNAATLEVPRHVTVTQTELGDVIATVVQTVIDGDGSLVITAPSVLSAGNEAALPHTVSVSQTGGISGLTITFQIRDGTGTTSYLDFNDSTFKTSGWGQQSATLTSLGNGFYTGTIDMSSITNLPTNALVLEYTISGTINAVVVAPLELVQHTIWGSVAALTLGKFLALKDI